MVDYLEGTTGRRGAQRGAPVAPGVPEARFAVLRRRYAVHSGVLVVLFLGWYAAYLLLSVFARDLMALRVAGAVNVGLLLGIAQFATTFLLAWVFVRCAERRLDPIADELRAGAGEVGGR
ncbi:DUF485 domain-containing protein [Nocardiopsis composta]|uniref:Uncharacterized membrane protein (DUF485 family) n=1 Tax=Nocardiopsis composta TaxID=157465 RepID=A0A7W8QLY9_9ACTN|nr:DUF485 domain-containing protein [Nocardiopsis composta]MBB5431871.1 uncharacterized membrane protein (DUF485 family) [Nocardiopsis composta]